MLVFQKFKKNKEDKNKSFDMKKRKLVILSLFFSLVFFKANSTNAALWSNVATDLAIYANGQLMIQIRISANAAAKILSIKQTQASIQSMLNSGSGNQYFIKNHEEFLITDPKKKALTSTQKIMEVSLLRGRGSSYEVEGAIEEEGISLNYYARLENLGKTTLYGNGQSGVDLSACPKGFIDGSDVNIFADGNMECLVTLMSNPDNLPAGFSGKVQSIYLEELEDNRRVSDTLAQSAGGYLPILDEKGDVIKPGSMTAGIDFKVFELPIMSLAGANSKEESAGISALVTSMIPKLVNGYSNEMDTKAKNDYMRFSLQYGKQFSAVLEKNGPLTRFGVKGFWD